MAPRWRLTQPHYLNTVEDGGPGAVWEYKENDRATGKPIRRQFPVPIYLSPFEPGDWNYRYNQDDGDVIVATDPSTEGPKDIIFLGEPTPDMQPMNDEAKAISASFATKWKHPIESLPSQGYSQSLLSDIEREVAKQASANAAPAEPSQAFVDVLAAMTQAMKSNQDLMAQLVAGQVTAGTTGRRV